MFAALLAGSALLLSCDPVQGRAFAVGYDLDGTLVILHNPCGNRAVGEIQLLKVNGNVYGDSNDDLLWKVTVAEPRQLDKIIVGVVPDGFEEEMSPPSTLPESSSLAVFLTYASGRRDGTSFKLEKLRGIPSRTFIDALDRQHTAEEFMHLDTCDDWV
jgi:hypothetical protein